MSMAFSSPSLFLMETAKYVPSPLPFAIAQRSELAACVPGHNDIRMPLLFMPYDNSDAKLKSSDKKWLEFNVIHDEDILSLRIRLLRLPFDKVVVLSMIINIIH